MLLLLLLLVLVDYVLLQETLGVGLQEGGGR
jgi:hypothetical protein